MTAMTSATLIPQEAANATVVIRPCESTSRPLRKAAHKCWQVMTSRIWRSWKMRRWSLTAAAEAAAAVGAPSARSWPCHNNSSDAELAREDDEGMVAGMQKAKALLQRRQLTLQTWHMAQISCTTAAAMTTTTFLMAAKSTGVCAIATRPACYCRAAEAADGARRRASCKPR